MKVGWTRASYTAHPKREKIYKTNKERQQKIDRQTQMQNDGHMIQNDRINERFIRSFVHWNHKERTHSHMASIGVLMNPKFIRSWRHPPRPGDEQCKSWVDKTRKLLPKPQGKRKECHHYPNASPHADTNANTHANAIWSNIERSEKIRMIYE